MSSQQNDILMAVIGPGGSHEVVEEEVRGIPMRVYKNAPRTLVDTLKRSLNFAERTFVVYEDDAWTFSQHFDVVAKLADQLINEFGVKPGDRVAIAMRNFPEWIASFWAATVTGAIVVPLNAWWSGSELEYALSDSGSAVLIADQDRAERLVEYLPNTAVQTRIIVRGELDGWHAFDDVVAASTATELPDVQIDPDDDATIFYTSGTTGAPKGALGTHRNICSMTGYSDHAAAKAAASAGRILPPPAERPQTGRLLSVPLFHVTGCHATMVGAMATGSKLVMMYRWDPVEAMRLIEREKLTSFGGVPSMVWEVLESPRFEEFDLSSIQSIGYGGTQAPPELVRRIEKNFTVASPGTGYGLTETSSVAIANGGADYLRKPASIGKPIDVVDVRIVDPDNNDVPLGDVGELLVRGPNVVRGYWNKPEETANSFVDGWLRTGDLAYLDDEGFVTITDRVKDVVIRGGENVYCAEVEGVLYEHPAVTEACVLGVPHRVLGEEVGAILVLRPGTAATTEEIQSHVKASLAGFKVPTHVWFREEPLPRNAAGKILKRELREELLAN